MKVHFIEDFGHEIIVLFQWFMFHGVNFSNMTGLNLDWQQ